MQTSKVIRQGARQLPLSSLKTTRSFAFVLCSSTLCFFFASSLKPPQQANSGDSRSVMSVGGEAKPLSFDHKPTNPGENARIVAAGGFVEFGRVNGERFSPGGTNTSTELCWGRLQETWHCREHWVISNSSRMLHWMPSIKSSQRTQISLCMNQPQTTSLS